jgi:GrpB-like predicted nucleotidyltransferase (UPF0157 family)
MEILIQDYDENWPILFQNEKTLIQQTIGDSIIDFEHIGSTAVPGMSAKNVIDMMCSIQSIEAVATDIAPKLYGIGYVYQSEGEKVQPWVRFFCKAPPSGIRYFLYILEYRCPEWEDYWQKHLLIRNYLRNHPEVNERYSAFKKIISVHFEADSLNYLRCKIPFMATMLNRAKEEISANSSL